MSAAPPDFVGVGTHLAGTRWWFELLREHPGICGPLSDDEGLRFELLLFPIPNAGRVQIGALFQLSIPLPLQPLTRVQWSKEVPNLDSLTVDVFVRPFLFDAVTSLKQARAEFLSRP